MAGGEATRFGELLRHHRLAAGLTQAELAERAGLSRCGINNREQLGDRQFKCLLERSPIHRGGICPILPPLGWVHPRPSAA
jgi:Helix-turn-helix domain